MADQPPLLFVSRLGGLFPANAVAEKAMQDIKGAVRCEIKGGVSNERRRGLYWSVLALVVPLLNEAHQMTLDDNDLHFITRQKLNVGEWVELPSGERFFKPASTSSRAMNEAQRSDYTNRALELWSKWTGVEATTLKAESQNTY